jgi:hypothetical protein
MVQPIFTISTIGMLGIAFTGGGKRDSELSTESKETAMFLRCLRCFNISTADR